MLEKYCKNQTKIWGKINNNMTIGKTLGNMAKIERQCGNNLAVTWQRYCKNSGKKQQYGKDIAKIVGKSRET